MKNIINFAIIAHVDHGKSTLADRFLEITGVIKKGIHAEQMLDRNPISRERGITIKLAPVRMNYTLNAINYTLNLIDTPGHVDFSYEVERTLSCVEGVILLVDATKGIQAQTIAHAYKALEQNLVIIPAVNKIDLPQGEVEKTKKEIADFLGISESEVFEISAKTGQNVEKLLNAVIQRIPPALSTPGVESGTRALIFDSYYDSFRGVIAFVKVLEGNIQKNKKLSLIASNANFTVKEVGIFTPLLMPKETLSAGEIGYLVSNLKDIHLVAVGDTVATYGVTPLPGYKKVMPVVYASLFPTDPDSFPRLKESLEKLSLNDASLTYTGIYSKAFGSGFKAAFLGLLHADVVRERLEREFDLSLILTPPTVSYQERNGKLLEPIVDVTIVTPQEYLGEVMRLCESSRGIFKIMDNKRHVYLNYEMPLAEIITTFFDDLKSVTSGFASFDWNFKDYRECDASLMMILLNGKPIEELSEYIVSDKAFLRGRFITSRLKELIPRQQYEVRIQAKYKGKIIASSRLAPFRKDVTAKLYGGDRTRKDKLLQKQKKGKENLKKVGQIEIPKEVFFKVFRRS